MAQVDTTRALNRRGSQLTDPIRNFRFIVRFIVPSLTTNARTDGRGWTPSPQIGFSSVDGLGIAVDSAEIREGGYNTTVHLIPTQIRYSPVTFQRGMTIGSSQHWDWMRTMFDVVQGRADVGPGTAGLFRSDIEISLLHHPVRIQSGGLGERLIGEDYAWKAASDDVVAARFRLYNAWPSKVIYSSMNAMDNALMVEHMTVLHEGLDMRWGKADYETGKWTEAPEFD